MNRTSELDGARVIRVDHVHQVLDLLYRQIETGVEEDTAKLGLVNLSEGTTCEQV